MENRLLITCFEPFDGRLSNTSMRLLGKLQINPPDGIKTMVLPVDFSALKRIIPRIIRENKPDKWLLLGENAKCDCMNCEKIAVNILAGNKSDNRGIMPSGKVLKSGPAAYFTTLDPIWLSRFFESRSIPASVSDSAGTFACNMALYLALHHSRRIGKPREVGFVHVPRTYRRTGHTLQYLREALEDLAEIIAESGENQS